MKLLKKIKRYWKAWKVTRISEEYVRTLSLYPNHPHKSLAQIRKELFWLCRNPKRGAAGAPINTIMQYFNMGVDREGEDVHNYVFLTEIWNARNKKQPPTAFVLEDKWVTARYLQLCGIETTCPVLYKTPFTTDEEAIQKIKQSNHKRFFAKLVDGVQGKGAFSFTLDEDGFHIGSELIAEGALTKKLKGYIVEPYIEQHESLNALYPNAVSSFRIVTVCVNNNIEVILTCMFVGAGGTSMSNLHQGGLRLPISESGELGEIGVRLNVVRGLYKSHPDTGVVFKGFKVPYWEKVIELAIRAHKCFPSIPSVGWDVAISRTGPLIIEGNPKWGAASFQCTNGPGREYMKKYFTDIK